jgi:hypothetical protein
MQELVADASVSTDRGSDFLDVGTDRLDMHSRSHSISSQLS